MNTKRKIILSDTHGSFSFLKIVLELSGFKLGEDELIFLGDVCDFRSEVKLSMELLNKMNALFLLGNHDWCHVVQEPCRPWGNSIDLDGTTFEWRRMVLNDEWKWAHAVGDFLLTHAGISMEFMRLQNGEFDNLNAQEFAEVLNHEFQELLKITDGVVTGMVHPGWGNDPHSERSRERRLLLTREVGPLWWRPFHNSSLFGETPEKDLPFTELKQIVGHTPFDDLRYEPEKDLWLVEHDFHMIDPGVRRVKDDVYRADLEGFAVWGELTFTDGDWQFTRKVVGL